MGRTQTGASSIRKCPWKLGLAVPGGFYATHAYARGGPAGCGHARVFYSPGHRPRC
ncbi:hypothetical protein Ae717Ps2_6077 [Pseudonocardia sp. Ae717_Ps2]|nr:hypothetical protein Ae717Ps2_6077 [Pseudonocardia sp. Ae717_Ps2]